MARCRPRSIFWVVSTHVVTTLFLMVPVVIVASFFTVVFRPAPSLAILFGPVFLLVGLAGTTAYSIQNICTVATMDRPMACIMPSVLTFSSLLFTPVAGLICHDIRDGAINFGDVAFISTFTLAMCAVFGLLTRRGFGKMDVQQPQGFPVIVGGSAIDLLPPAKETTPEVLAEEFLSSLDRE